MAIDVIRGIALFGVLVVNLTTEFRVSIFEQFLDLPASGNGIDRFIAQCIALAVESKAIALFSMLFGVGLAIQFDQLARRGNPDYWLVRRLLVLLAFGLVHLLFIWNGDILTEYAIVGLLALPFLRLPPRYLLAAAIASMLVFGLQPWSIRWPGVDILTPHVALAHVVYATGSYLDIVAFSHRELSLLLPLHLYLLPRTFALFLFGMTLWKTGIFTAQPRCTTIAAIAAAGILSGGACMLWSAQLRAAWPAVSQCVMNIAPVILAFGYGAAILALCHWPACARLLALFAPLGRMAFTNYLMQSIACGFIFYSYGLGYFGQLGVAQATLLAVAIFAIQLGISAFWLDRYRYGPMEWLWRTLMYGARQAMAIPR